MGVSLLVLRSPAGVSTLGLLGAFGSVLVSGVGFVMAKRWSAPVDLLTLVSWQLAAGGLALLPVAVLVEGAPPSVDARAALGFLWLSVVGTGLAYVCWLHGLSRMTAGAVSLIGLVNPVVGTTLGVLISDELFGWRQAVGMALVLGGVMAGQPALGAMWRWRRSREEADSTPTEMRQRASAVWRPSQARGGLPWRQS
jgi:probable blue pigment (indigoidine) exporter